MGRPDLEQLIAEYIDGSQDQAAQRALAEAIERDGAARDLLARTRYADRLLGQAGVASIDVDCVMRALPTATGTEFQDRVLARIARAAPARRRRAAITPERLAVAASLIGAVALTALIIGHAATRESQDTVVARLSATREAVWSGKTLHLNGDALAPTHLELTSGLAEVTFVSGARMLIEGPAVVDLETSLRARLVSGRVTAEVPVPAHGFTISASGVEVVDRGTAFGVEVLRDGRSEVQVFRGTVDATLVGDAAQVTRTSLFADQAVRLDPWRGTITRVTPDSARFVQQIVPAHLQLMLSDLVAGGDGRGTGTHDGLNPLTGEIVSGPATGLLVGDNLYHVTNGSPFIDGIFIPNGALGATTIDSLKHAFRFPVSDGKAYDLVRRGGTLEAPEFGGIEHPKIPPVFGGVDYDGFGHTAVGLHANVGITIDLHAIATAHPGMHAERFTARVANIGRKYGGEGLADFWILIDGRMLQHLVDIAPSSGSFPIDVLLAPDDHFLTLVSTDAGNGNGLDWITLGDARMHLSRSTAGP
jgi:hypothetical protein